MSRHDKLATKRVLFLARIQKIIPPFDEATLQELPHLSIRVNRIKSSAHFPDPIAWAPDCYWTNSDRAALTHDPAFEAGEIYLQNAASFIPPLLLDPQPTDKVLDMCAAPGGKASHLAAMTNNRAELWVNDNSRPRLAKMQANFERLGVTPHRTTLFAINRLARELPHNYFDKILLDAPCSGEGMMRLDNPKDFTYWSVAQIKRLQAQQKQAIITAWQLLKPGGRLVYSTCTIAPEENEVVIDYLLRHQPEASLRPIALELPNRIGALRAWNDRLFEHDLQNCLRLAPTRHIEAFFVAVLQKPA